MAPVPVHHPTNRAPRARRTVVVLLRDELGRRRPIGRSSLRMEQEVFSLLTGEVDKILWKWKSIGGGLSEGLHTQQAALQALAGACPGRGCLAVADLLSVEKCNDERRPKASGGWLIGASVSEHRVKVSIIALRGIASTGRLGVRPAAICGINC
jgi:hypothetical protein